MATKEKLDLYKLYMQDYLTPKKPTLVRINPAIYLTIDGQGEPGGETFQNRLGALYSVAFGLKMESKAAGRDYAVCKLEGLWWVREKEMSFLETAPSSWSWKLMVRTPDFIKRKDLARAIAGLERKGKSSAAAGVQLEKIDEGLSVQMLHVGPYREERSTIEQMMNFAQDRGLVFRGLHHEIYLSDPRRVPAQRLRTILRHPVE